MTALRMLIVDDDFMFTKMLPRLLHKRVARPQFDIVTAQTPDEAMEILGTQRFDLILCDFDLKSARTGLDVLRAASAEGNGAFRVLITGHPPRDVPDDGPVYDAFLDKPTTLREVVPPLLSIMHDLGFQVEASDAAG